MCLQLDLSRCLKLTICLIAAGIRDVNGAYSSSLTECLWFFVPWKQAYAHGSFSELD